MGDFPADLAMSSPHVAVLINTSSGSYGPDSEKILRQILLAAQIDPVWIRCVEGSSVRELLEQLDAASIDVLVVFGGDGTIRAAAERCGEAKISLIALPGGTMNMLPKALYGERSWEQALTQTLANPRALQVSGGEVGAHRFFCAGIFGSASLWADAREAARANHSWEAGQRAWIAFHRAFSKKLQYDFGDGKRGSAAAIAIICPLVSAALASEEQYLESVALDLSSSKEAFRLAWNALFADWRADASVLNAPTKLIQLASNGAIPAILDGEIVRLPRRAQIHFKLDCFVALVPSAA